MGSPWPQDPVKATNGASIHNHNSNNNKRTNNLGYNSYSPFYNNHHNHNHGLLQNFYPNQQLNGHNGARYLPSTPPASSVASSTLGEQMISNETRKRTHHQQQNHHNSYFNFEGNYHNPPPQPPPPLTHTNHSCRKAPASTISSTLSTNTCSSTSQQSQFVTFVKEIPTWNIYFSDQKHRIIDFTDKNNSILPDQDLNQLVSLCFVDTCITNLAVDAIVNSTSANYCGVTGVDKIIHQQAGRSLREACKSLSRLAPGQAEMTLGFSLPAKYVIHTNGPLTEDAEQLTACYVNSLNLLLMHGLRTIAFPCISTGKKGLSKKFAAEIALRTVRQFLEEHKHQVDRVIFCLHNQKDIEIYLRYMQIYFPVAVEPEYRMAKWEQYFKMEGDF